MNTLARATLGLAPIFMGSHLFFLGEKDGILRMCIDQRDLNQQTKLDKYPLPIIDDLLDWLVSAHYFNSIELYSAYH